MQLARNLQSTQPHPVMVASRRRSTRKKGEETPQRSQSAVSQDPEPELEPEETPSASTSTKDSCPACADSAQDRQQIVNGDTWIRCDACKKWFHWVCVASPNQDHESVGRWSVLSNVSSFTESLYLRTGTANHVRMLMNPG